MAKAKAAHVDSLPTRALSAPVEVALDATYLSPLNPRQVVAVDEIAALAGSIATVGLLQPLIGHQDADGRVGITGGGRRWRALRLLADEGWTRCAAIDPQVRVTPDEAQAIAWAGAEQEAHVALHPADEITAYAALRAQQVPPATIARTFAVTEAHVARRLALADLPAEVIAALRANEIGIDVARALTLAPSTERAGDVLQAAIRQHWNSHQVRMEFTRGKVRADDRRVVFVGLDAIRREGIPVQEDLFSSDCYVDAGGALDGLFQDKAVTLVEERARTEGWSWAKYWPGNSYDFDSKGLAPLNRTPVELPDGDMARLEELAEMDNRSDAEEAEMETLETRAEGDFAEEERAEGGVVLIVSYRGQPEFHYWRRKDTDGGTGGGTGTTTRTVKGDKPLPEALLADLARIQLLSLQTALMDRPALMLDLLGWQISVDLPSYQVPIALSPSRPAIMPEKPEGTTVAEGLADPKHDYRAAGSFASFAAWLELSTEERLSRLGRSLARLFHGRKDEIARTLADQLAVNVRDVWTPTAAGYFSRIPGPLLDALYIDLTPADRADHKAFKALKKAGKVEALDNLFGDQKHAWRAAMQLTPEEEAALDSWLPKELQWAPPKVAEAAPESDPEAEEPDEDDGPADDVDDEDDDGDANG